jgi:hypothetical protein
MDVYNEFFEALLWTALKQINKNEDSHKKLFDGTRMKIYFDNNRFYTDDESNYEKFNRLSVFVENTFNNTRESKVFLQNHRYVNEFDEELMLGRGTFGVVYKVKNKTHCQYYAVKKQNIDDMFKCLKN